MSKSVLVIDTPKKCDSCMYVGTFHAFCRINCRDIKDLSTKPDWCPLKPLPEKMIIPRGARNTDGLEYACGYNTCINEITGGGDSDD
nr:MAG TPA: hypothetical protein [Caudoviricetes sp.]